MEGVKENPDWVNPMDDINHTNYRNGLIPGYKLAFQTEEWYTKNKNNFCTSLMKKYPEYLPDFAKQMNDLPPNYLGFAPDDLVRFGYIEQVELNLESDIVKFWVVRIPKGMQVYHTSRSLGLNHSDFPLKNYDNELSTSDNYKNSNASCRKDEYIGKNPEDAINANICTNVSFYSTPYLTKKYLISIKSKNKNKRFGENQVLYAYGLNENSEDKRYNDRIPILIEEEDFETKEDIEDYHVYDENDGVSAYTTNEDMYLMIFEIDNLLTDRPQFGRQNMRIFYDIMYKYKSDIQSLLNVDTLTYNRFLDLILSVSGIGSLQDNVDNIMRDYEIARNFDVKFYEWLQINTNKYIKNPIFTAGYIKTIARMIQNGVTDLSQFRGFRYSTFEHDRPVFNMLNWLFTNFKTTKKVSGFISSSVSLYSKSGNILSDDRYYDGNLEFYRTLIPFHSEMGLFYAPNNLIRNRENKYDLEYSINYKGINQELRKYKTSNIMHFDYVPGNDGVKGFHQGHLFEHSNWVGIIASNIFNKEPFNEFNYEISTRNTYLLAGYLHDIGKSGDCTETYVYKGLHHQNALPSLCTYVKDDFKIIGMKYYDIPDHPEKGYEYLKGYRKYKKYTLQGLNTIQNYNDKAIDMYFEDWTEMFDHLDVDDFDKRLIRITAGAHWYFGNALRKLTISNDYVDIARTFIKKVEIFHNDEFYTLDVNRLRKVIMFVIVVSIADIIGSEYKITRNSEGLDQDLRATILNYLPNISESDIPTDTLLGLIDSIIEESENIKDASDFKKGILNNIELNTKNMINTVLEQLNTFEFNPFNNYSLLFNLINSYPDVLDIKRAYPKFFPKIIAFDLDQTLFAVQFKNNDLSEYHIYPDTYNVIKEVQKLRRGNNPTRIAITSRHYSPKSLKQLLLSKTYKNKENPLYYKNFDFIISKYTGPVEKIQQDVSNVSNFFIYNGAPDEGFKIDVIKGNFEPLDFNFPDVYKISKYGHFNTLSKNYNVKYKEILAFDDDEKYFSKKGLGAAKDVYVAGVLRSRNIEDQGIRMKLFKDGVAHYVFYRLNNTFD